MVWHFNPLVLDLVFFDRTISLERQPPPDSFLPRHCAAPCLPFLFILRSEFCRAYAPFVARLEVGLPKNGQEEYSFCPCPHLFRPHPTRNPVGGASSGCIVRFFRPRFFSTAKHTFDEGGACHPVFFFDPQNALFPPCHRPPPAPSPEPPPAALPQRAALQLRKND